MNGFRKVEAGHYRHNETGVEIRRVPAHRRYGYQVGERWHILNPSEKTHEMVTYGSSRRLRDAIEWATTGEDSFVERARARIAEALDEAHAENVERSAETILTARAHQRVPAFRNDNRTPVPGERVMTTSTEAADRSSAGAIAGQR